MVPASLALGEGADIPTNILTILRNLVIITGGGHPGLLILTTGY